MTAGPTRLRFEGLVAAQDQKAASSVSGLMLWRSGSHLLTQTEDKP